MYRGNKKFARRMRRLHNEAKDKPQPWWRDDDYVWEPYHIKVARERARWKRRERKLATPSWYTDFGVTPAASKHTYHRRHQRKPYERPHKT